MIEESKVEKAVETGLAKIQPSSDLLDRINREADNLALRGGQRRPSIWSRLRLGSKLEVAAACILLVGLVGIAAYRNVNSSQAPGGGKQGSDIQQVAPNPELAAFVPNADEVTIARITGFDLPQTYQPLQTSNSADLVVISKVLSWLERGQVVGRFSPEDVAQGRDLDLPRNRSNLVRFELRNGGYASVRLAYECSSPESGSGTTCYAIDGEVIFTPAGDQPPFRLRQMELANWLASGWQRDYRTENSSTGSDFLSASDVVAKMLAAGLDAEPTGDLSTKLFGAKQVSTVSAEGENVVVYVFDNAVSAENALRTMQDPHAHTVGWVGRPQFFQMGNLVIQIDFSNEPVAQKLKVALLSRLDLQGPGPNSGDVTKRLSVQDVTSAYIPGQPKMANWRLTEDAVKKVIAMVQAAQWVAGDESAPSPSSGPAQPLTLVLELRNGDSVSIRLAGDCQSTTRADGSQVTTCSTSESDVLVSYQGRMGRWHAPDLARWLSVEWQADVRR